MRQYVAVSLFSFINKCDLSSCFHAVFPSHYICATCLHCMTGSGMTGDFLQGDLMIRHDVEREREKHGRQVEG